MPAGYRPVCLPYLYISSSLSGTWVYAALKSSVCVPAHGDDTGPSLVTLFFCGALVVIELKVKRHRYMSAYDECPIQLASTYIQYLAVFFVAQVY